MVLFNFYFILTIFVYFDVFKECFSHNYMSRALTIKSLDAHPLRIILSKSLYYQYGSN